MSHNDLMSGYYAIRNSQLRERESICADYLTELSEYPASIITFKQYLLAMRGR